MKTRPFSWLQQALYCRYSLGVWARALARLGNPVTGKGDKLTDGRVRQARYVSTKQPLFAIRTAVSQ